MNVPRLRFKEFSGRWVEKKLHEISDIKTGPFGSTLHEADYVLSGTPIITVEHLGEQGVVHQNLPLVSDEDKARLKSYHLKEGDVVFSRVGSVDRSCLISPKENGWLFSGRLLRVRLTNDNSCPKFLNQNFKNDLVKYRVRSVAVGQTMASLNTEILKNFHLTFPPFKPEQTKIANFLTAVDEKIAQLTQKADLLARYKKGVMQQIFSQQLRFKDDDGQDFPEWDDSTIGELINEKSIKFNPNKHSDKFKCIELEHLSQDTGRLLGYVDGANQKSIKNKFDKGDILFGKLRPYLKKFLKAPFDGVCSTEIWVLKGKKLSNDFLYQLVQTEHFLTLTNISSGSKMPRADWGIVSSSIIQYPSLPEQAKVANFLTALDDKISHNQTQLNALKQYKQGLLQQMFV
jgi:type I restriction enzyme S subunit